MYVIGIIAAVLAGYLAGLLTVRRHTPHPGHCPEATWCTHCGMTTGTRCPVHKQDAVSTGTQREI